MGVDCFTSAGAPQNRDFTIEYARGGNLMGLDGPADANALANGTSGGGDGDAQVTTVGTGAVTCGFYEIGTHPPAVYVNCSNPAGHPANTAFTFQWVVKK